MILQELNVKLNGNTFVSKETAEKYLFDTEKSIMINRGNEIPYSLTCINEIKNEFVFIPDKTAMIFDLFKNLTVVLDVDLPIVLNLDLKVTPQENQHWILEKLDNEI